MHKNWNIVFLQKLCERMHWKTVFPLAKVFLFPWRTLHSLTQAFKYSFSAQTFYESMHWLKYHFPPISHAKSILFPWEILHKLAKRFALSFTKVMHCLVKPCVCSQKHWNIFFFSHFILARGLSYFVEHIMFANQENQTSFNIFLIH